MQVRILDVLDSHYGDKCGQDLIEYARGSTGTLFVRSLL
jgi:hypothetical protein